MGISVLVLSQIFESNIYFLSSLFFGLTISAIPFIIYEERNTLKGQYKNLIFTILGTALVVLLTAFRANSAEIGSLDFLNLNFFQYGYLVISGILAVSAMLLPGVSGSTMLLILGVYVPTISAVKELFHLNIGYLPGVIATCVGILTGIIFASKAIKKGFIKYRSQMLYLIIGLLIGSLYAIIMGPTTLNIPKAPMSFNTFNIVAFLSGIAILAGLEFIKKRAENKKHIELV